jgi:hypothetical protein
MVFANWSLLSRKQPEKTWQQTYPFQRRGNTAALEKSNKQKTKVQLMMRSNNQTTTQEEEG